MNATKAPARDTARDLSQARALPAVLLAGLAIRLAFISSAGFETDIRTYMSWALALGSHGFGSFYATIGFVDYPPGYFYVLAAIAHVWQLLFAAHDPSLGILRILVKLPAVIADVGVGALVYAIARRFGSANVALGAAALYMLNPATIYISAVWGQVDAISGGLALLAVYFLLRSQDDAPGSLYSRPIIFAWLALAYSLLIKPQAAVLLPLFVAFAFVDAARRRTRLISTAIGIVAGLCLALILLEPFHPSNPIAGFSWLWGRYAVGAGIYPYNSVNAFNLWALRGTLWVPDNRYIAFLPTFAWGIVLVAAALALIVWRYVQERTAQALLEGCAVATLAFFVLATRMHERYLFDALAFTIACLPIARRYLYATIALSVVLFANLIYSLQYLNVFTGNVIGSLNTQNLWGTWTSLYALAAIATFFVLGYQYLGTNDARSQSVPAPKPVPSSGASAQQQVDVRAGFRNWFDPREGLLPLRISIDYAIMAAFGIGNFILSFVGYWWPTTKVFDEIYFARAGEEYLQNLRIYENTHPPLSKLLVTLSMMLFGGMPRGHGLGGWSGLNAIIGHMANGDNSYGWRFLDVVFGALVVVLLYAFAKRVTGSTLFASIAALLLTLDGMHFVQSRIATPEGFVIFFATFATYAFYRFWISSQVGERPAVSVPRWAFLAGIGGAIIGGAAVAGILWAGLHLETATLIVVSLYVACGIYLLVRYLAYPAFFGDGRRELSFAEGSYALRDGDAITVHAADGGTIDSRGKISRGAQSQSKGGMLVYSDDPLTIEYGRDAGVTYSTPDGTASYADDEIHASFKEGSVPVDTVEKGKSSRLWLMLFTIALGCLVSSKWYGVMGFGVSFLILIGVWFQRYAVQLRPTIWGNPRGFRIDGALVTIVFVSATVYGLVWVPDLIRQAPDPNEIHNLNDIVDRQYSMFEYHDTLKATHPYSSKWWEWPLDYVPVAYFYEDHRKDQTDPHGCCIYEITSMPNPLILWFGLLTVPWIALLAWREGNKGYALIVITYLLQWLPWMRSPRITFAYHFYVDIPLICLCNAVILQRVWQWSRRPGNAQWWGVLAVGSYVAVTLGAFIFFYPILAAAPISWDAWHARMWIDKWIIGPG